jgi:Sec-independent protein secretion pathway component TatC
VAAVATPGGDPFSMVILSLFMYGLFEATLLVVRALQRNSSSSGASGTDVDR